MTHLLLTLELLFGAMTLLWGVSTVLKDVSIVDIFWGPGFALVAWIMAARTPAFDLREGAVLFLVSCWALRLGGHILLRKLKEPHEDHRYGAMRIKQGTAFWWKSLFMVFWLQALLLWLISWPLQAAFLSKTPFNWLDSIGVTLSAVGIALEAIADFQLTRFKSQSGYKDRVLDSGVWAWSRHPNYFGNFIMWWGFYLIGLAGAGPWWTIFSPVVMSALLIHYSGAGLMEETITSRRPGYADYMRRTSMFVPWPRKI